MKKIIQTILKVLGIIFIVLLIAFVGLYVYAKFFYGSDDELEIKQFFVSELPLQPSEFEADFDELHQIVMENYSLYESKELNMDSLYQSFSERVRQARTTADYGLLVQEYIATLKCSHASTAYRYYFIDAMVKYIEGEVFISNPGEELLDAGFMDKDRIVAIDGISVKEWMEDNSRLRPASTPAFNRLSSARSTIVSLTDSLRSYTIMRDSDTLNLHAEMKRPDGSPFVADPVETKVLQDSIGYLSIPSMQDPVMEQFAEAYPKIKDMPYLIIDIRENGGGNSGNGIKLCRYFIHDEQPHCLNNQIDRPYTLKPEPDAYKGKVYLLTSTFTCSAAESFAIDMWESGNAILVGEPTAGDTGNKPRYFCTSRGTYFRIPTNQPALSPKGFPLEGVGIPPHHEVYQTIEDYMMGKDTVLDYIVGLIID